MKDPWTRADACGLTPSCSSHSETCCRRLRSCPVDSLHVNMTPYMMEDVKLGMLGTLYAWVLLFKRSTTASRPMTGNAARVAVCKLSIHAASMGQLAPRCAMASCRAFCMTVCFACGQRGPSGLPTLRKPTPLNALVVQVKGSSAGVAPTMSFFVDKSSTPSTINRPPNGRVSAIGWVKMAADYVNTDFVFKAVPNTSAPVVATVTNVTAVSVGEVEVRADRVGLRDPLYLGDGSVRRLWVAVDVGYTLPESHVFYVYAWRSGDANAERVFDDIIINDSLSVSGILTNVGETPTDSIHVYYPNFVSELKDSAEPNGVLLGTINLFGGNASAYTVLIEEEDGTGIVDAAYSVSSEGGVKIYQDVTEVGARAAGSAYMGPNAKTKTLQVNISDRGLETWATMHLIALSNPVFTLEVSGESILNRATLGEDLLLGTFSNQRVVLDAGTFGDIPANLEIRRVNTDDYEVYYVGGEALPRTVTLDLTGVTFTENGRVFYPFSELEPQTLTLSAPLSITGFGFNFSEGLESYTGACVHESDLSAVSATVYYSGGKPGETVSVSVSTSTSAECLTNLSAEGSYAKAFGDVDISIDGEIETSFVVSAVSEAGAFVLPAGFLTCGGLGAPLPGTTRYTSRAVDVSFTSTTVSVPVTNTADGLSFLNTRIVNVFSDVVQPVIVIGEGSSTTVNHPASFLVNSIVVDYDKFVAGGITSPNGTPSVAVARVGGGAARYGVDSSKNIIVSVASSSPDPESYTVTVADSFEGESASAGASASNTFTFDRYLAPSRITTRYTETNPLLLGHMYSTDRETDIANNRIMTTNTSSHGLYTVYHLTVYDVNYFSGTLTATLTTPENDSAPFLSTTINPGSSEGLADVQITIYDVLLSIRPQFVLTLVSDYQQQVADEWVVDGDSVWHYGAADEVIIIASATFTFDNASMFFNNIFTRRVLSGVTLTNYGPSSDLQADGHEGNDVLASIRGSRIFAYNADGTLGLFEDSLYSVLGRTTGTNSAAVVGIFAGTSTSGRTLSEFYSDVTSNIAFYNQSGALMGAYLVLYNMTWYGKTGLLGSNKPAILAYTDDVVATSDDYVIQVVSVTIASGGFNTSNGVISGVVDRRSYLTQTGACSSTGATSAFVTTETNPSVSVTSTSFLYPLRTVVNTEITAPETSLLVRASPLDVDQFPDSLRLLIDVDEIQNSAGGTGNIIYSLQARVIGSEGAWYVMSEDLDSGLTSEDVKTAVEGPTWPERKNILDGDGLVLPWSADNALEYRLLVQNKAAYLEVTSVDMVVYGTYQVTSHRDAFCNLQYYDYHVVAVGNDKVTRSTLMDNVGNRAIYTYAFSDNKTVDKTRDHAAPFTRRNITSVKLPFFYLDLD